MVSGFCTSAWHLYDGLWMIGVSFGWWGLDDAIWIMDNIYGIWIWVLGQASGSGFWDVNYVLWVWVLDLGLWMCILDAVLWVLDGGVCYLAFGFWLWWFLGSGVRFLGDWSWIMKICCWILCVVFMFCILAFKLWSWVMGYGLWLLNIGLWVLGLIIWTIGEICSFCLLWKVSLFPQLGICLDKCVYKCFNIHNNEHYGLHFFCIKQIIAEWLHLQNDKFHGQCILMTTIFAKLTMWDLLLI